jgi:NAD(P)H-hydrate epimerase
VTFIGAKRGLFTGDGPDHTGVVEFDELALPQRVYDRVPVNAQLIDRACAAALAPRRRPGAHKGDCGHVLVLGGDVGMAGATRLAGEAAARSGAGLVSLGTRAQHAGALAAECPVLMAHGLEDTAGLRQLLTRATVLVAGPGLGRADWGQRLCAAALDVPLPRVVDADALWHLAAEPRRYDSWVLTPHPGEAARLLDSDTGAVQADRFAAAQAIAERYGGVCVLKGAGTLVAAAKQPTLLCDRGSPLLASGGTGDVLAGMIAALVAQGLTPRDAATLGVWVHAVAGECMTPGDLAMDLIGHAAAVLAAL